MNKRERLEKAIAGEATDRIPVALWRHWQGDDQRAADLARSTIEFQLTYDWDFVKVTPAETYAVVDYGLQDEWHGDPSGTRLTIKLAINRSLDWTTLRPLDPARGSLGKQLEMLHLVTEGLRQQDTPIIHTIYSPLTQAAMIGGRDMLVRQIRTNPDRVQTGLNAITESTLRFIEAIRKYPLAGIFYCQREASYDVITEDEYRLFGLPYDRKILENLSERWWFNVLHLPGDAPMIRVCAQLPVQVINWRDQDTEPDLSQGKLQFNYAVSGGLASGQHLHLGTPSSIREQIRHVFAQVNSRRLILSTGSALMATTPLSNIRAVQEVTQGLR